MVKYYALMYDMLSMDICINIIYILYITKVLEGHAESPQLRVVTSGLGKKGLGEGWLKGDLGFP